jgi:hypothetical protein
MSITDIVAGRMAPAQTLGMGYVAPLPGLQQGLSPLLQAAGGYGRAVLNSPARLPGLFQAGVQNFARLPAFFWPHLKALAPDLRRREASSDKLLIRALLRSEASATLVRLLAYAGTLVALGFAAASFVWTARSRWASRKRGSNGGR